MTRSTSSHTQSTMLLATAALFAAANPAQAAPDTLALFVGQLAPGLNITIADMEGEVPYHNEAVQVPKPAQARVPTSEVRAKPIALEGGGQGVQLQWKEAWYSAVRIEAEQPLDLRPYLDEGTLEFDVRSPDLSQSGLNIAMACGSDCARKVNYVAPSRALAGHGWQHLSFAMRCFVRDGADFSSVKRPFVLESSGTAEVAVANVRIQRQGKPNAFCPDYASQSVTPAPLEEVWSMEWWRPRHEKKLAEIRQLQEAGSEPELVFIGDSITQGWEDAGRKVWDAHLAKYHALNLGYGGDRTENVLWRLLHGELDGYRAKVVVLMIGTNNTGDRQEDPHTTAAGIRRLLDEIRQRQPQAKVLLLAVYPREEKPGVLRAINERVNQQIAGFAASRQVFFLNINAQLSNPDGSLSADVMLDWLHLSEKGYEIVARAIEPTLHKLLTP